MCPVPALTGAPPGFLTCPTAGLIGLETDASTWKSIGGTGAVMRWFLRPKLIEALTD
jgi:hypothetical protein